MKINNFNFVAKFCKFLIFCFCCSFVADRGYTCLEKFLQKPQSVEISYQFIGDLDFPSIAFCPQTGGKNLQPFNKKVLKSCNLTLKEYHTTGPWIGKNGLCNDPKKLYKDLIPSLDDFGLLEIKVQLFNKGNPNSEALNFTHFSLM